VYRSKPCDDREVRGSKSDAATGTCFVANGGLQ